MDRKQRRTRLSTKQRLTTLKWKMQGKEILHFLHIGKTGGTAVKYAFSKAGPNNRYGIHLHDHPITLRHVPRGEGVIFFLRDPIDRFVSGFYSRRRQGQPRYFTPWTPEEADAFSYFLTPNELAVALSSPDPDKQARARQAMNNIQHVKQSYWDWFENDQYFRLRSSDVFFVGTQENLAKDFEILRLKLGLSDTAKLPDTDIDAHRNPRDLNKLLEDGAVGNLKHWYQDDYRFVSLCSELFESHNS